MHHFLNIKLQRMILKQVIFRLKDLVTVLLLGPRFQIMGNGWFMEHDLMNIQA